MLERDDVDPTVSSLGAPEVERRGIPHYLQPHAFLPRGRRLLADWAPDVLEALVDAGADPQDLALKLRGPRQPGDEDLVYLWVRRPVVEWALRRAADAEPAVEIRGGVEVCGLLTRGEGADASRGRGDRGRRRCAGRCRRRRARPLPLPPGVAARRRRAPIRGDLLLPLLRARRGSRALDGADPQPARRPRLHGLQHLPRGQPDLRGDPARAGGRPRAAGSCATSTCGGPRATRSARSI